MKTSRTTQRLQQLLPQLFQAEQQKLGERYLLFEIIPNIQGAIPLDQVWEATHLPADAITPVPLTPPYVLGWSNGRDRVYCVISLQELLNLGTVMKTPQFHATIVVQVPSQQSDHRSLLLGLTVNRILRTIIIPPEQIHSSVGNFPAALTPYSQGYFLYDDHPIALLDLTLLEAQMESSLN